MNRSGTKTTKTSARKPSQADRFTSLFDNNWKENKSTIRTRLEENRLYDVSYSWDAKSDNPQSFSRLQAEYLPHQFSKPLTLSGPAVVLLEKNTHGFNAINVKAPQPHSAAIPLTVDQQDVNMPPDLSGKIPVLEQSKQVGGVVIASEGRTFKNQNLSAPKLEAAQQPAFMVAAGPQADQKLLNPQQRREIMEFTKKKSEADRIMREAHAARMKTRAQMEGQQFHRGVLMCDSSDNMKSEIYGQRAVQNAAHFDYKEQIRLERKSRLANKTGEMSLCGNILLPETLGPRRKLEPQYQSKGGDYHNLSFDETYNRLFCRMKNASDGARTQLLRDIDSSGKQYDIVNHTTVESWPARSYDREVSRAIAHPSQAALETQRNLQGSMRL